MSDIETRQALVDEQVEELLWPAVVLRRHTSFGLRWRSGTVDEPLLLLGGWLMLVGSEIPRPRRNKTSAPGKLRFVSLEDDGMLRISADENCNGTKTINLSSMQRVEAVCANSGLSFIRVVYHSGPAETNNNTTMMRRTSTATSASSTDDAAASALISTNGATTRSKFRRRSGHHSMVFRTVAGDDDTLCRWVALLRFHGGSHLWSDPLRYRRTQAERAAVFLQTCYRRKRAQAKAARMRRRREGLMARVGYWWTGSYNDSDSDESDGDGTGFDADNHNNNDDTNSNAADKTAEGRDSFSSFDMMDLGRPSDNSDGVAGNDAPRKISLASFRPRFSSRARPRTSSSDAAKVGRKRPALDRSKVDQAQNTSVSMARKPTIVLSEGPAPAKPPTTAVAPFTGAEPNDPGGNFVVSVLNALMNDLYVQTVGSYGSTGSNNNSGEDPNAIVPVNLEDGITSGEERSFLRRSMQRSAIRRSKRQSGAPQDGYMLLHDVRGATRRNSALLRRSLGSGAAVAAMPTNQRNSSDQLQRTHDLPELAPFEVEDEGWENQRWEPVKGYGGAGYLLPGERLPYSDRTGRQGAAKLDAKLPLGWKVSRQFAVDLSGLPLNHCDPDGWQYQRDFRAIDADLARGDPKPASSSSCFVRRRRWYRRRVPIVVPPLDLPGSPSYGVGQAGPSPILYEGWLGKRSPASHRWTSRYFILSRGLVLGGRVTGVLLTCFRYNFKSYEDMMHGNNIAKWATMRPKGKHIRTILLDACRVSEHVATAVKPGWFAIMPADSSADRYFNASGSARARRAWVLHIRRAVMQQYRQFTLSRTLAARPAAAGGPFTQPKRFENTVLDRLIPLPVDEAVELLFADDAVATTIMESNGAFDIAMGPWSRGLNTGSRREVTCKLPAQPRKRLPVSDVLFKRKMVRACPGEGYHIDASMQSFRVQYGRIFQVELRFVATKWAPNPNHTRLILTQTTAIESSDVELKTYLSSLWKKHTLTFYCDTWLPGVKDAVERRLKNRAPEPRAVGVVSPSGAHYDVPLHAKDLKSKVLSVFGGITKAD